MIICLIGTATSACLIVNWNQNANTNKKIKKTLKKYIAVEKEKILNIDFDKLKEINSDTVAYIKVPNTNVDYVIVKGQDNDYYLKHDFNKNPSELGWIFMNYKNKLDNTDKNLVIFGHDTPDGSMFGSLEKYLHEEMIKDENNLIIDFYTDDNWKQYKIFSIYTITPEDYYIKTDFSKEDFEQFKLKMKDRSIYNIDASLENKKILTLSTCQNYGAKRLAIHAVEL